MENNQRVALIEEEWSAIEASYRLDPCFAPKNQDEERARVIDAYEQGTVYDPQFAYAALPNFPVERIVKFMSTLQPGTEIIDRLYFEKAQAELLGIQAVQSRTPGAVTAYAAYAFGLPALDTIEKATQILSDETLLFAGTKNSDITAEEAASFLQGGLDKLGLADWSAIVFEPMNSRVAVNRLDRQVKIRRGAQFAVEDLDRLLVHEIGVHVVRFENGRLQPSQLFSSAFPQYIATEEGLAVYSEQMAGLLENATLRKYAGRVIAAYLSLTNPFSTVFARMMEYFDGSEAFEICARAKRGLEDTSLLGAHTKDMVYLSGYVDVSNYLHTHPEHYEVLFMGKFGLQHVGWVLDLRSAGTLQSAKYLPTDLA